MNRKFQIGFFLCVILTLVSCGGESQTPYVDEVPMEDVSIQQEQAVLSEEVPLPDLLIPEASGMLVEETEEAVIDYSNTADGYVMVNYKGENEKRLKVQVKGPVTTYTYNIQPGSWETFPLSDGNGAYKIALFENVEGSKYALVQSVETEVAMEDEFAPFLRPNQYVNYAQAENTIKTAAQLTYGKTQPLEKVEAVYTYVVENISYDKELAQQVESGYLPVLDEVLEKKKGICFDYAAVMAGMLRSQSVPCKLVVGYAGETYHAWISVYSEQDGWIDNVIYFDGAVWKRMDPTFASSGGQSKEMMEYIGDGTNYTEKYLY